MNVLFAVYVVIYLSVYVNAGEPFEGLYPYPSAVILKFS